MKRIAIPMTGLLLFLMACQQRPQSGGSMNSQGEQWKQETLTKLKDSLKLDSFLKEEARQKAENTQKEANVGYKPRAGNTRAPVHTSQASPTKKGWSDAAKGTAIGAGLGALTGVLVDKKDGRGAVIGGLAGAGAGYAIGRAEDRKSGRVPKKN